MAAWNQTFEPEVITMLVRQTGGGNSCPLPHMQGKGRQDEGDGRDAQNGQSSQLNHSYSPPLHLRATRVHF